MKIISYLILIIPIVIFLYSFKVTFEKKQRPTGLQFITTAILIIVLFTYHLLDTGEIFKYVIKKGEVDYYISPYALEDIIIKNIDKLGLAVARVYEKYYIKEIFDCSKESEDVKFEQDEQGKIYMKLKLKFSPVENSVLTYNNAGFQYVASADGLTPNYKNGFYFIRFGDIKEVGSLKKIAENQKLITEVRYFRKQ